MVTDECNESEMIFKSQVREKHPTDTRASKLRRQKQNLDKERSSFDSINLDLTKSPSKYKQSVMEEIQENSRNSKRSSTPSGYVSIDLGEVMEDQEDFKKLMPSSQFDNQAPWR